MRHLLTKLPWPNIIMAMVVFALYAVPMWWAFPDTEAIAKVGKYWGGLTFFCVIVGFACRERHAPFEL